jgi:hypothetical protein
MAPSIPSVAACPVFGLVRDGDHTWWAAIVPCLAKVDYQIIAANSTIRLLVS